MHNADNRFEVEFIAALNQALDIVEHTFHSAEDLEDTALITTGNDRIYSNGLNLQHALVDVTFMDKFLALLRRILTFPVPTVAAINGWILILVAHDRGFLCVASCQLNNVKMLLTDLLIQIQNEVDLPAPLAPGMPAIIREKLAPHAYRNIILQGYRFNAKESRQEHIVDEIAESDKVLDTAKALALTWAPKAQSGVVYRQLKDEMYTNVVAKLSMPYHRLAPKM